MFGLFQPDSLAKSSPLNSRRVLVVGTGPVLPSLETLRKSNNLSIPFRKLGHFCKFAATTAQSCQYKLFTSWTKTFISTTWDKSRVLRESGEARLEVRHKTPTIYQNKHSHRRRSELRFSIKTAGPAIGVERTH